MKKTDKPVDYLTAMEQIHREEQNERNQIHSLDFIPPEEAVADYMAVSKAWDTHCKARML